MAIMLILCVKRELDAFVDELTDWQEDGANIFLYGITSKAAYGFIFLEWEKPIPDLFHTKMRQDNDVIDYLVLGKNIPPALQPDKPQPA